jgi:hypothetical protein
MKSEDVGANDRVVDFCSEVVRTYGKQVVVGNNRSSREMSKHANL